MLLAMAKGWLDTLSNAKILQDWLLQLTLITRWVVCKHRLITGYCWVARLFCLLIFTFKDNKHAFIETKQQVSSSLLQVSTHFNYTLLQVCCSAISWKEYVRPKPILWAYHPLKCLSVATPVLYLETADGVWAISNCITHRFQCNRSPWWIFNKLS